MSSTISICNQKGGVGKTTTAINLSSYLALKGLKVLLIDLDPQGNATSGLKIDKNTLVATVYDVLIKGLSLDEILKGTEIENLSVAPSNLQLTGCSMELVNMFDRERRLFTAISQIKHKYDFIFIDCPPSLGILTINSLAASDSILVPLQCEYYALEGISQLLKIVELVRERLNPELNIDGFLLTMADQRTKLSEEVADEARSYFKDKLYKTIIRRNVKLSEAPSYGRPIALYDDKCIGAQRYHDFSEEFLCRRRYKFLDVPRGTLLDQETEDREQKTENRRQK